MSSRPALLCFALVACSSHQVIVPEPDEPTTATEPTSTPSIPTVEVATPEPPAKACTKMGCMSMLDLEVEHEAGKKGRWVVEVEADGQRGKCEMKLPLPRCGEPASRCEGTLPIMAREGDGCQKPPAEQALFPMTVGLTPEKLVVRITLDGRKIAEETITPLYETFQPNGPGCDPVCKKAEVRVTAGGSKTPPVRVTSDSEAAAVATKCARDRKMRGVWKSELVLANPQVQKVNDKWLVTFAEQRPAGKPQGAALFVTAAGGCAIAPQE